uniref:Protein SDA1 n=1 Tax=Octactis speculum TaxID=3111310 RepID=A0A7S2CST8_9STRA
MIEFLRENASNVAPDLRLTLMQALILLRNRDFIEATELLPLIFELLEIQDKTLRALMCTHIINDIRKRNTSGGNKNNFNKKVQALLFSMIRQEDSEMRAKKSLDVVVELYRRRIWTDGATVNTIAAGCTSKHTKIMVTALNFFLGIESKMADDDDETAVDTNALEVKEHRHSRKTLSRAHRTERQTKWKEKKIRDLDNKAPQALFPALQLLNDPQGLAEGLFRKLRGSNERFEVKLLAMNMVSRLIGSHQLLLLSFYSFTQRYLTSHQKHVTQVLSYLVQASHPLVPPSDMVPVIKTIANNFIADRCPEEVIAVGINGVREILSRIPSILTEPDMDDFVQDISLYAHNKNKSVTMAGRSFVNLIREEYPALLKRKERGKDHVKDAKPLAYGQSHVSTGVEGADLLEAYERGELELSDESGDEEDGFVECEEEGEDVEGEEEEEGEEGEAPELVPVSANGSAEDRQGRKRPRIDAVRILGAEDFARIERLKAEFKVGGKRRGGDYRTGVSKSDLDDGFAPSDLDAYHVNRRKNMEERMATVLQGREKFMMKSHAGGLTNTEKRRTKNQAMVKHGRAVREKISKSSKQVVKGARRNSKGKVKILMKHDKKKRRRT